MLLMLLAQDAGNGVRDTVEQIAGTRDQVILSALALLGTCIAILGYVIRNNTLVKTAVVQATEANKAVNNIGPGDHRLYDKIHKIETDLGKMLETQAAFAESGWQNLPSDLDDAVSLTETIRDIQHEQAECRNRLDSLRELLVEHVQWEQAQKYPRP